MRICCVLLVLAATLVSTTDATTFTSTESKQVNAAKLVLPDEAQLAQVAPKRLLRTYTSTGQEREGEERVGDINLLTFLPKFVKQMEGKSNLDIMLHLQQLKFTDKQRQAFLQLYHAHIEKAAKAAAKAATRN